MPGCSSGAQVVAAAAASMTGSTDQGPIRPHQLQVDSAVPFIVEKGFFAGGVGEVAPPSYLAHPDLKLARRVKMSAARPVQLTPLWEYVVRTQKFPKNVEVSTIFEEISDRLRDPEWEVRQHALRVLVDVLPTIGPEAIDELASLVLADLIDNLGHPAPAVRKGSLDALRIYLVHSLRRDEVTGKILHEGINRADVLDEYQTRVATGVILSAPLLLFPSRSIPRPSRKLVRDTSQALAMRLGQVTHQESALRSLAKIREAVGRDEFNGYLAELDDAMIRNFELLCDVYGITSDPGRKKRRPRSKSVIDKLRRTDSLEDIKDVVPVDKSWDSDEDSDTSGIAEEDEDGLRSGSGSLNSARVVLETEIKFNEETAITMTILEDQGKNSKRETSKYDDDDQREVDEKDVRVEIDDRAQEDRRKNTRRVHFGGEIVKLRTPDSEDTDSVSSSIVQSSNSLQPFAQQPASRTRIPLPVSPATTMPRRPRSSSQPIPPRRRPGQQQRRRSASNSPRREAHTHLANLSPKKSILCRGSEFGERHLGYLDRPFVIQEVPRVKSPRVSRRDSVTPAPSPRIVIEEIFDDQPQNEPSFRVCEESKAMTPQIRSPSPSLFGDVVDSNRSRDQIDEVFGEKSRVEYVPDKMQKNYENTIRSALDRPNSALEKITKFDFGDDREHSGSHGMERRRSSSAKIHSFEPFPRKERNYILMELSSPTKDRSRRSSLEDANPSPETKSSEENKESSESTSGGGGSSDRKEDEGQQQDEKVEDIQLELVADEEHEKASLDAKERSSDTSSDSEMKLQEPSWEELGLVDEEVLTDFHNKEDWRARVRGLERIASAMRTPSSLAAVEPRLGSLLHAVLGGERSCRVAAAGLAVAGIVLTGVSEDALRERLSLVTWGLARQGGPNAANLARVAMLRTSPRLFLDNLLQPHCIESRNAKMRENALQLLIFSLVTFPSTEFEVKHAIDKIVDMVGDRRKRVRLAALEALAVLSQIYESEDILEVSRRLTKGKQEGHNIQAAIKTRLGRKLLPTVSVDGLVVYGLQISSNSQHTGADIDWIVAGSGSVSPGTGRTRGQLIAMSKTVEANEQNNEMKESRVRPVSEYADPYGMNNKLLDKNERIASWKLLPQSDENGKPRQKLSYTKSADLSAVKKKGLDIRSEESFEKYNHSQKPYATPKRSEKKSEFQVSSGTKFQEDARKKYFTSQVRASSSAPALDRIVPRQESRIPIPIHPSSRGSGSKSTVMDSSTSDSSSYLSMQQRRKIQNLRNSMLRTNLAVNHTFSNNYRYPHVSKNYDDYDPNTNYKENRTASPLRNFKDNDNRTLSDEKLNRNYDTALKNSRQGSRSVPHYEYTRRLSESYESIYQRQQRLKDERGLRMYELSPNPLYQGYEGYLLNKKLQVASENKEFRRDLQSLPRGAQVRPVFSSPFDDRSFSSKVVGFSDGKKLEHETDSSSNQADSGCTATPPATTRMPPSDHLRVASSASLRHDLDEAGSNSARSSSSSSNRSSRSSGQQDHVRPHHQTLAAHTESDESNLDIGLDARSRASSSADRLDEDDDEEEKAFDVISEKQVHDYDAVSISDDHSSIPDLKKHHPSPVAPGRSSSSDSLSEYHWGSQPRGLGRSRSALSIGARSQATVAEQRRMSKHSLESLLSDTRSRTSANKHPRMPLNGYSMERLHAGGDGVVASRPCSRCSSDKDELDGRVSSDRPASSRVDPSDKNHIVEEDQDDASESPSSEEDNQEEEEEERSRRESFETLDFRNGPREIANATPVQLATPTTRSRMSSARDDLRTADSTYSLYSNNGAPFPKRFTANDTDSDDVPPIRIGFGTRFDGCDDVWVKQRLPTPVDHQMSRRGTTAGMAAASKVPPCRLRPQPSCRQHHASSDCKAPSKHVQQCFSHLESKDWEVTLKGLRTLSQVARDEPEQLDACAPGQLARVLGKHVKNLRSQVARVACSAAGEVFSAHIRGIDQDLDEVAGPLLHRTADTNKFLREDCNAALDIMIEHFPPHRTIMTIANRGASHQNTIVHATTARLLYIIVTEIGPEHVMILPRDVKDKLFLTTAKLLTDGHLQARKHAKETFRLLSRCEGFRKALTDAVPETTLRLIDKTLKSL